MSPSIQLSDGRKLGYELLGDPEGTPVFFFHGTPGARFVLTSGDEMAQIPGVRLILPERPGYGLSDPSPKRTLLDWPGDVVQLADHLGLETFAVAGESGGGPHVLACAHALADRVSLALVFSSPSPGNFQGATRGMAFGNRLGLILGRFAPWLNRRLIRFAASGFAQDPQGFLDALSRQMGPPDQTLLADPTFREALIRDLTEAYRQGSVGHEVDGALAITHRSWGFDLREISVPVYLWHGEADTLVPMPMARYLEREIPNAELRIVPGAAHLLVDEPSVIQEVRKVLTGESTG